MSETAPQDLVLSILGAHLRPRASAAVWSGGLVTLLGGFGFSPGASRVALTRLVNAGLLTRAKAGRHVHYTLTARAVRVLTEGDERIFSLGDRPGPITWTVLWHAIPDDRRDARARLVRRLRFLGFGQVQDGTWLAARDRAEPVTALCADLGVEKHTGVLLGAPVPDFAPFVRRVWDLDALAARYTAFTEEFGRASRVDTDADAFLLRVRLVHAFRQFALLDPELPADLVAPPPDRAAAVRLFHDLYPALEIPALRHFDGVMTP